MQLFMLPIEYAAMELKNGDYDRYMIVLSSPASERLFLFSLFAFYLEIKTISKKVTEPMIGLIRLAWWREALEEIESGKPVRKHEILLALEEQLKSKPHIIPHLKNIIETVEDDAVSYLLTACGVSAPYTAKAYGAYELLKEKPDLVDKYLIDKALEYVLEAKKEKHNRVSFFHLIIAEHYLKKVKNNSYEISSNLFKKSKLSLQIKLLYHSLRKIT